MENKKNDISFIDEVSDDQLDHVSGGVINIYDGGDPDQQYWKYTCPACGNAAVTNYWPEYCNTCKHTNIGCELYNP